MCSSRKQLVTHHIPAMLAKTMERCVLYHGDHHLRLVNVKGQFGYLLVVSSMTLECLAM